MKELFRKLLHRGGVNRAVFFSLATQVTRLVTGPIAMLMMIRHLTPEMQGYYYAFYGVVALQVFLEMGFSQNIVQFASHEFAKLRFTDDGRLEGDPASLSRLISLGRLAFMYYTVAAVLFLAAVGTGGYFFFKSSVTTGLPWQWVWWTLIIASAGALVINPAWSFLEGCNQVWRVARFRFWQSLGLFAVNVCSLAAGFGLFTATAIAWATLLSSLAYIAFAWGKFFRQFRGAPTHERISWAREIWPFQWRIAVSWMSGYMTFEATAPVAFRYCGAMEAGKLGMTLQLLRMISGAASSWLNVRVPVFGILVASRDWIQFDLLWRRSTVQAIGVYLLGLCCLPVGVRLLTYFIPAFPDRIADWKVFLALAIGMMAHLLMAAMAFELRAHKREPYMVTAVCCAITSVLLMVPFAKFWGIHGQSIGYGTAALLSLPPALWIYLVKRCEYRTPQPRNLQHP